MAEQAGATATAEAQNAAADDARTGTEQQQDATDWKSEARKHEERSKAHFAKVTELEAKLAQFEEATKSEHEKALEQARREAAEAAETPLRQELRNARLEAAVARLAAGKFKHPEHAEKLLELGDDVFDDDGKVKPKVVEDAIAEFLKKYPDHALNGRPSGDADAGKGTGGEAGGMNDLIRQKARR